MTGSGSYYLAMLQKRGYGLAAQAERQQQAERRAWKEEAEELRLRVPAGRIFGCEDLPHYAVALRGLECRLEVHEPMGISELDHGKFTYYEPQGAAQKALYHYDHQTHPGQTVTFRVVGPDAKKALPLIEETFYGGRENHLAVLRRYVRMNEEEDGAA